MDYEILIIEDKYEVVVQNDIVEILSIAEQGPPGVGGGGGSSTFVQESEPISGMVEGSLWFNPVTSVTQVYAGGVWVLQSADDGYF